LIKAMHKPRFSLVAAATLVLSTSVLCAQAKPSPYEGTSAPPADDTINTTEQQAPATVTKPEPAPATPTQTPNPDAGIIEKPLPPSVQEYTPHANATLQTRSLSDSSTDDTDAGIVTYVPTPANALSAGTTFRVRMLQEINASSTTPNTPFKATLTQDLMRNGKVVVPVGSELHGRVVYATAGSRWSGGSVLHLRPDEFVLPDGTRYPLHAQVIETLGSDTTAKGEGNIVANEHGKRTVAELGMGAGGGAIIGAAVGGGVGAVVGTAVGAGVVTAHWLRTTWSANLPESSTVVFSLTDPMFLVPAQDQKTELLPQKF
jgi:hypothetical protein